MTGHIRISSLWSGLICTLVLCLMLPRPGASATEEQVLELIRQLEAPGGYDTVYSGVTVKPPRPITTLSVEEVLAWQRSTVRQGSVSSAAGSYQIIRPTLQRLVDQGVVSRTARFDAATQDRLGRHLLRETGYRNGDTSVATANRIAAVWAALPQVGGTDAGRSVYEGIAGNHALISADTYMAVLGGTANMTTVGIESDVIRAGERFGFAWDRFLGDWGRASTKVMKAVAGLAISLLLGLCVVDFVLRAGHWIFSGNLPGSMGGLAMRLLTICLCLAVLRFPDVLPGFVDATARHVAGQAGAGGDFSIASFSAGRTALAFSLLEGLFTHPRPIQVLLNIICLLLCLTTAFQIAFILFWSLNLTMVGAAGLFAMGFGGLKESSAIPEAYIRHLISAGLALLCVLLITATTGPIGWTVRAEGSIPAAALSILLMEAMACLMIWVLPATVAGVVRR